MWKFIEVKIVNSFEMNEKNKMYHVIIFTFQCVYFESFLDKYVKLSNVITMKYFHNIEELVIQKRRRKKYKKTLITFFNKKIMNFFDKFINFNSKN